MIDPWFDHMVERHHDFVRRFNEGDAIGIASTFYAPDAVLFVPGRSPLVGRSAILSYLSKVHAQRRRRCDIEIDRVESSGHLLYVIGRYSVTDLDGTVEERGRLLETWRFEEDRWWCVADMYGEEKGSSD